MYKLLLLLKIFLGERNFCYEVNLFPVEKCGELPHVNTPSYIRDMLRMAKSVKDL